MTPPPAKETAEELSVQDAISGMGLLIQDAFETILGLVRSLVSEHPRKSIARFRGDEPQVLDSTKKSLGIQRNSRLSLSAYEQLSELGREVPLDSHLQTLVRAKNSMWRYSKLQSAIVLGVTEVRFSSPLLLCASCRNTNETFIRTEALSFLPPEGCNCECVAFLDFRLPSRRYPHTNRAPSTAARTKSANSGCGAKGFDFSSG